MKVLPLVGYKSLRALNAFHTLLLGMKMLPVHIGESYESFFESFKAKTEAEKETMIREAAVFVQLTQEEVEALCSFCADKNGIPYRSENIGNLNAGQIHEIIVAVCMELGRIRVDILSEAEKKNSQLSRSS